MPIGTSAKARVTPVIRVLDERGFPLNNVTTFLEIADIVTQTTKSTPVCDKTYREDFAGSLEYIRLNQVCRIVTQNGAVLTDRLGQASFPNFLIETYE